MCKIKHDISIVSPVYRSESIIDKLVKEIEINVSEITNNYEIILIEDGGPDDSWGKIESICKINKRVKGIKLSRNFGQHNAITSGLTVANAEWVIVMDCDLQDRPDQFRKLYEKAMQGYDLVYARRLLRQDVWSKRLSSKLFYWLFSYLTGTKQDAAIGNFGIYSNKVIESILSMKDHIRYFPTMSQWVGFNRSFVDVIHGSREEGESSYSFRKLLSLMFDNIITFSDKPLKLTAQFGFIIALISGLIGFKYLVMYILGSIEVLGFTTLIISIWFLSGMIIFFLGMIGVYLGKTFEQSKNRPVFLIDKKLNFENQSST